MNSNKASILADKYVKGECTPEERALLLAYFNELLDLHHEELSPDEIQRLSGNTWDAINNQIDKYQEKKSIVPLWKRWLPYVAAIIVLLTGGMLLIHEPDADPATSIAKIGQDIVPLGDRATLTLADGRMIELKAEQTGIVFSDNTITYADGSSIHGERLLPHDTYQLSTPKGATFQITLPDGTKVWLNGDTQIRYPGKFATTKRLVELEGEAYFSVVKQNGIPFIVSTEGQKIEVLGTEFNISTYEETSTKTTLSEGSVRVTSKSLPSTSLQLSPGEQSILYTDGILNKKKVNLKQELAWRSGIFYFDETPFADIMQQVARWYDVDIRYETGIPKGTFSGVIDREVSLRTLIEFFGESSRYEFRLENKIVIVTAKKNK
ncbi:DUF4974 domain-containing protein [Sphingobacterium sp. SGG-5]|uniref:FecR family protein n=1 Tax=Sphingobacterium sp. SGG-5 TaxID=2710881 RepID=UPI0013EC8E4D|nr:FecR family protein [Sphingobacterium sp. SGG-5]NGM63309.1 DUF4974 domain-containing protein [Sphingobacterium sp. SGG-5]